MSRILLRCKQRRRKPGRVTNCEQIKRNVIVPALERRCRRQNNMCVPGRLVNIEINRDHELEAAERPIQLTAIRRRQDGIAGGSNQSLYLPRTFSQNFLRERCHRQLSGKFRELAHATVPATKTTARRQRFRRRYWIKRGKREHGPAWAILISGYCIQDINQPLKNAAELLCAHTDSS